MFYILDKRNKKVALGPYTEKEARRGAEDLNDFVNKNAKIKSEPFHYMPGYHVK